jgi:glucose/arabinose dehydrogenase
MRLPRAVGAAVMAAALVVTGSRPGRASLSTPGFRAVAVAHVAHPVSAMAVAPDGRLFVAVQADGQTSGTTPGTAEIRTYTSFGTTDGSLLDAGVLWATVEGVRATTAEEGLLGLTLAPDFSVSKLVYVYLTTTDESVNQHVRVYHENAGGTGDYLGTVLTGLEPPTESTNRNGGGITFGADGCLYTGVGDNGSGNRWNAQLLIGTDPLRSSENGPLCSGVCLGTSLYPDRAIATDGALNDAGKILRVAVSGTTSGPAPGAPLARQPFIFGAGLRNPVGLTVHPLTGQLYVTERGDTQTPEVDVVDSGSNLGWPCLEGATVSASSVAACLAGHVADEVYASHPDWRRPIAVHAGNPALTGIAVYTGLAYPAAYYGDVFYLLRDSARIYRLDLDPPCFLPHPAGVTPVALHDSTADGDFTVNYDFDGDGSYENLSFPVMVAITQGPDPLGRQVLYVAGKQGNSSSLSERSVIFRIEFALAFTPYAGPVGRVADSCFTDGVYSGGSGATAPYGFENPFLRQACQSDVGPCFGQADGTPCGGGSVCHGSRVCQGGVCQEGAVAPDGTRCGDEDPCNGVETCVAGSCQPGAGPAPLTVRSLSVRRGMGGARGAFTMRGAFTPVGAIAPEAADALTVDLRDDAGPLFSGALAHPASDHFWKRPRADVWSYLDPRGSSVGLTTVQMRRLASGNVQVTVRGRPADVRGLNGTASARLAVGQQCFASDLAGRCAAAPRGFRCRPALR